MSGNDALILATLSISIAACTTGKLDLGGTGTTAESPGPNDVVGIVQLSDGSPVTVNVLSGDTLTQTDRQGRFVLRNVPSRYDVALAAPPGTMRTEAAFVYVGLTTRRPILTVYGAIPPNFSYPSTSLDVSYPASTVAETRHLLFVDVPTKQGTASLVDPDIDFPKPPYGLLLLPSTSSADAQVASFEFTSPHQMPAANYLGYATATLHFEAGTTTSWTPTYSPVDTMTVSGSVTLGDPSQMAYQSYLYMRLSDTGNWASVFPEAPIPLPPNSFVVPKVAGVSWAILYNAFGPGGPPAGGMSWAWARIGADGSVPSVRIPPSPRAVFPPDGTTGFGVGSVLTWAGEGVCTVTALSAGNSDFPSPSISIVTDQQTATIPDTSALGITFPRLVTYDWNVRCAETSEPPYGGDPVLLPGDPLESGGSSVAIPAHTVVTR